MWRFWILTISIIVYEFTLKANDSIPKPGSFGFIIGYQRATNNFIQLGITKEISFEGNDIEIIFSNRLYSLYSIGHRYYNFNVSYNPLNKFTEYDLGFNTGGLIAIGLHTDYYRFDLKYRFGLKPEIGIIVNRFQLLYGYNFKIAGSDNRILSRNSIRFSCYFPIFGKMNHATFYHPLNKKSKLKRK
jgi:hypothetical protein